MRSFRFLLCVFFVAGLISTGCKTRRSGDSTLQEEINYTDRSGRKQGPWEIYADSVLIAKGTFKGGKPDGLWTYWYVNGKMKEEGHYKQGVKKGMWVEWYPDGDMMWKGEYENGKRHIGNPAAKAEITFIGEVPDDDILQQGHTYQLSIRIQNVPSRHLFVETSKGSITREEGSGLFILETPSDTMLTLAIGFIPELEFKDFRNLVTEIDFKIR